MTDSKIETAIGYCVVALTKHIMKKYNESPDKAFRRLMGLELYSLLLDSDTRLFLETNEYLCECCDVELDQGIDKLYERIDPLK